MIFNHLSSHGEFIDHSRAQMVIFATKGPGHKLYQCTQQPAAGSLQQAMAIKHANAKQPSLTRVAYRLPNKWLLPSEPPLPCLLQDACLH